MMSHTATAGKADASRPRRDRRQVLAARKHWINSRIVEASAHGDFNQILAVVVDHLAEMNLVNLSTALHRLSKAALSSPNLQKCLQTNPVMEDLLEASLTSLSLTSPMEVHPRALSNIAWSLATLQVVHTDLVQKVVELAIPRLDGFKPFELSTLLWSCARLAAEEDGVSKSTEPIYAACAPYIITRIQSFGFRSLSNIAWAFAEARQRQPVLFEYISREMLMQAHTASTQELANATWAFGKAGCRDAGLLTELAERALTRLGEFRAQELCSTVWGFGAVGFFHEAFFAQASLALQGVNLQAQQLAHLVWAFAQAAPQISLTRIAIVRLLPRCLLQLEANAFAPLEVSVILLSVARAFAANTKGGLALPREVTQLLGTAATWAVPRMRSFSAQSLTGMVKVYKEMQHDRAWNLMDAVGKEVLRRRQEDPACPELDDYWLALCAGAAGDVEYAQEQIQPTTYVHKSRPKTNTILNVKRANVAGPRAAGHVTKLQAPALAAPTPAGAAAPAAPLGGDNFSDFAAPVFMALPSRQISAASTDASSMDVTALPPYERADLAPPQPTLPWSAVASYANASVAGLLPSTPIAAAGQTPSPDKGAPPQAAKGDKLDSESTEDLTILSTCSDPSAKDAPLTVCPAMTPGLGGYDGGGGDSAGVAPPLDSGGEADGRWKFSVKNSFLHVESEHDDPGASRRSRSAPGGLVGRRGAAGAGAGAGAAAAPLADDGASGGRGGAVGEAPPRWMRPRRRQATWQPGVAVGR